MKKIFKKTGKCIEGKDFDVELTTIQYTIKDGNSPLGITGVPRIRRECNKGVTCKSITCLYNKQ